MAEPSLPAPLSPLATPSPPKVHATSSVRPHPPREVPKPPSSGPPMPLRQGPPRPPGSGVPRPPGSGPPRPLLSSPPKSAGVSRPPRPAGANPPRPAGANPPRPAGASPPRPAGANPPRPAGTGPPRPAGASPPRPASAPLLQPAPKPVNKPAPTKPSSPKKPESIEPSKPGPSEPELTMPKPTTPEPKARQDETPSSPPLESPRADIPVPTRQPRAVPEPSRSFSPSESKRDLATPMGAMSDNGSDMSEGPVLQTQLVAEACMRNFEGMMREWTEKLQAAVLQDRRALEERARELDRREEEFREESAAYEQEKELVAILNKHAEQIVHIRVLGEKFTLSRETLLKQPKSMLAGLFTGKHTLSTLPDGSFFIERDPKLFRKLIRFLIDPRLFRVPKDPDALLDLAVEADYYGLEIPGIPVMPDVGSSDAGGSGGRSSP